MPAPRTTPRRPAGGAGSVRRARGDELSGQQADRWPTTTDPAHLRPTRRCAAHERRPPGRQAGQPHRRAGRWPSRRADRPLDRIAMQPGPSAAGCRPFMAPRAGRTGRATNPAGFRIDSRSAVAAARPVQARGAGLAWLGRDGAAWPRLIGRQRHRILILQPAIKVRAERKDSADLAAGHRPDRQPALVGPADDGGPVAPQIGADRLPTIDALAALNIRRDDCLRRLHGVAPASPICPRTMDSLRIRLRQSCLTVLQRKPLPLSGDRPMLNKPTIRRRKASRSVATSPRNSLQHFTRLTTPTS